MSSLDVSKERSSIQSGYVRRGQRKAAASFRADRPFRAKSRPDTEKGSEYTWAYVCEEEASLYAAFASARHGADNSSSSIRSVSSAFLRTGRRNRQPCQDKTVYAAKKARRSYRLCAGTSSSFYQKRIIRFSPEKRRFIPHRPSFPCPDMEKGSSVSQPKKPFAFFQSFLNQRYSPVTGSISPFWRAGTPAMMA